MCAVVLCRVNIKYIGSSIEPLLALSNGEFIRLSMFRLAKFVSTGFGVWILTCRTWNTYNGGDGHGCTSDRT